MDKEYTLFGQKIPATSLVLGVISLLSLCLIAFVIIPQVSAISDLNEKIRTKSSDVASLKQSLTNLNTISENVLNNDYTVANEALPSNKNIIAVFTRVNQIAVDSNAALSGFTLKVGDIYAKDAKKAQLTPQNGLPLLEISVTLAVDDKASISQFIDEVYKSLPVAKITKVSSDDASASFDIAFYYKPYDLDTIQNTNEIKPYQQTNGNTLQKIKGWESK